MYTPLSERKYDMSTIAERANAQGINLQAKTMLVRGYDFTPSSITNEEEKEFIFRSLFPIGLDAFVQNPSEAMERDIRDHLFSADHLLVMRSDGTFTFGLCGIGQPRPVAFRMWKTYQTSYGKALYLAGMCVLPAWQGLGIGQSMTKYAIAVEQPKVVFTVTQNPVVKECMDKATGVPSFPTIWLANGTMKPMVRELGNVLKKNVEAETSIIPKNYGGTLYGIQPRSRDARNEALFGVLDKKAGDAFLLHTVL
jgi:ribosomal protein S18 acetylase RimI-like enzyme